MLIFILQMLIMASLAAILYIVARILPRIDDADVGKIRENISFQRVVRYFEGVDSTFSSLFNKFLRKIHIVILKFDNVIGEKLSSFKKESEKEILPPFPIEKEKKLEEDKEE